MKGCNVIPQPNSISEIVEGEVALNVFQVLQLVGATEINRITDELVQYTLLSLKLKLVFL
jgi:hypothetical protein